MTNEIVLMDKLQVIIMDSGQLFLRIIERSIFLNKKILSNSIWMMSEKIITLFGLIFVTSFVAKYVGA